MNTTIDLLALLRNHLRTHDTEYPEVEKAYQEAVQSLKTALKPDTIPLLDVYITAQDDRITACLRFLFWQGLHLNEACFRDPIQKHFLNQDFEDICQEGILNSLSEAVRAYDYGWQLYLSLTDAEKAQAEPITEYHCHLETAGYKLAHYWGFRYGDELLSKVVPGYVPDLAVTVAYRRMVLDFLEFDPEA